jgi:D-alanyl-D-alanine carboxypeptidase
MRQASFPLASAVHVVLVITLAFGLSEQAAAQRAPVNDTTSRLKAVLQRDLNSYLQRRAAEHLSSLSLTVSPGKRRSSINVTAGTTRFRAGSAVTPASLYQIGSNTKAFTAVAVLQLEAQHRLSIDAPIGAYLPQYRAYRQLTLRRLLSMTGGLESYDNTPSWESSYAKSPSANVSADALIRLVYPHVKFPRGTMYYYSNTGYLLAQKVVDARSRSGSFDTEIARIFASVHLRDTFYTSHLYAPPIARRVVAGYYENDDPGLKRFLGADMSGYSLSWAQGAGSIVSTPADLANWARALYEGMTLLPATQRKELGELISTKTGRPLAKPTAADPTGFGLGVSERFDPKLGTFWFYQGETLGFRAAHLYFPDSDLVVCLFANSRPKETDSDLRALFATLYAHIKAAAK